MFSLGGVTPRFRWSHSQCLVRQVRSGVKFRLSMLATWPSVPNDESLRQCLVFLHRTVHRPSPAVNAIREVSDVEKALLDHVARCLSASTADSTHYHEVGVFVEARQMGRQLAKRYVDRAI